VQNLSDWYRHGPLRHAPQVHRTVVPTGDRLIEAGPVQLINVSPPPGAVVEGPVPEYALHLFLRSAPLLRIGFNRRPRWVAVPPGSLLVAPPDTACEFIGDAPAHALSLIIPKAHVEDFSHDTGARIDVRDEAVFQDPRLAGQLIELWYALADDPPEARWLADEAMRAVFVTLALRSDRPAQRRLGREQLANHVLGHIRDFVESHLAGDLDVPALAAVAGLSPAHFARAFATTVGMTPGRYVMLRRLAHAREALERTDRAALDIALDAGFKTPSHFAARFRREFGVTPREVRPDRRRRASRLLHGASL
jgi:AraC family transcriptional regulator